MKRLFCLLASCWLLTAPHVAPTAGFQRGATSGQPARAPLAWQVFPSPAHGEFTVRLPDAAARAGS